MTDENDRPEDNFKNVDIYGNDLGTNPGRRYHPGIPCPWPTCSRDDFAWRASIKRHINFNHPDHVGGKYDPGYRPPSWRRVLRLLRLSSRA